MDLTINNTTPWPAIRSDVIWADEEKNNEPKFYEYEEDVFALVCAMMREEHMDLADIHTALEGISSRPPVVIEHMDRERGTAIRQHFKNNIMMRRLKGLHISNFMEAVEDLVDPEKPVNQEHIKILVKLPTFYEESLLTTSILEGRKTLDEDDYKQYKDFDCVVKPVGKVHRIAKNDNAHRFYCVNEHNEIFSFFIKSGDASLPIWKYLMKKEQFRIKGSARVDLQPGHELYHYKVGYDYEITDTNN